MIESQLGVVLDDFMLKEKRQEFNETSKEMLRSQQKRLIKGNRGKDKEEKEGRPNVMITAAATVREVGVVEGG